MKEIFAVIISNHPLRVALIAWVAAQVLKVVINIIVYGKLDLMRLIGAGGMPSAHSAIVTALAAVIGRETGWDSPFFAISTVLALVVMYDAAGVRQAAGKQAKVINRIIREIYHHTHISQENLKELIGHTPFEVFVGALLGLTLGLVL